MAAKAYQFRQMLKHEYMKPPTIMPATELAAPLSDSQAPIIPPTAMLASNQKIQIANLVNGACRFGAHHFLGMSAPIGSAPLASNRPHHGVIEHMHCADGLLNVPHCQARLRSHPRFLSVRWRTYPNNFFERDKIGNKWRQIKGASSNKWRQIKGASS
jgi:hypothetical protein